MSEIEDTVTTLVIAWREKEWGHIAQEIQNAKMYIGFNKFWLPNRVGSGTGTKRAVVDRSSYFPIVAWGTSTAVVTNGVISAALIHKKEFRQLKTTKKQQEELSLGPNQ